ncbi:MAG: hypothetical protein KA010_00850 [Saprospiraceae bacterium]|nr:hypothetical protein [Saprospiraceae bacterium]
MLNIKVKFLHTLALAAILCGCCQFSACSSSKSDKDVAASTEAMNQTTTPTSDTTKTQSATTDTPKDAWSVAKSFGVIFRAVGYKPTPWTLEISNDDRELTFGIDSTSIKNRFEITKAKNHDLPATYELSNGEHKIRIDIVKKPCSDGATNYSYSHQVNVLWNNKTYSGCGKSL